MSAKVAEYQRRGTLHFHALIRLDAVNPTTRIASWRRMLRSHRSC
ncbi:MAG TPA: replication initiator [Amycolatopsis sp.]|nr:replication initiator [Amycolatopsis sp.]